MAPIATTNSFSSSGSILAPSPSAAPPPPDSIVIQELIGNPPQTVTLSGDDMPEGRRHEQAAFESGGKVDIADDGIYNPGSGRVVLQVMARKYHPMVLKGSFRDVFYSVGHARNQRDALESIAERTNPVRVTWGDQVREGLLWETRYGEQSANDITYELTFFVAVPPQGKSRPPVLPQASADPADLIAQLQAQADLLQAALDKVALQAEVQAIIANSWEATQVALQNALLAGAIMSAATDVTPQGLITTVRRVQAVSHSAQAQVQALKALYSGLSVDDLDSPEASDRFMAEATLAQVALDSYVQFLAILDGLRTLSQNAAQAVKRATRIYRVQTGDTLESIAFSQLGSRARAMDLGIPVSALVPGNYVRIPEGT